MSAQPTGQSAQLLASGRRVLQDEAAALTALGTSLGPEFSAACELLLACSGRVIVAGIGKSGIIARKIAASLCSTGIPAHFLHPAEGVHGDLGVVRQNDLLLAISNSGETAEVVELLAPLRVRGVPIIAITRDPRSTLGRSAQVVLALGFAAEADPYNLVPSTSTTLTLALGDALVIALLEARGFSDRDFAALHPQGMLGRRLTLQVDDLLHGTTTNPVAAESVSLLEALHVISSFKLGGASVVDADGVLTGILTDGDVRRIFERLSDSGANVAATLRAPVAEQMTRNPTVIPAGTLAFEAMQIMENHQPRPIFIVPVVDASHRPLGMLHLHALVQAGFKATQES